MRTLHCWKIRWQLQGPLLTTSSAPMGFGIDAPFARNAVGDYYLPGSLAKGRLKEAWRQLADLAPNGGWNWQHWLGKNPPQQGEADWESERGVLQFTDLVFAPAGSDPVITDEAKQVVYRIAIDDETGAVKTAHNLMIQTPFAPGAKYWFEGSVWGILDTADVPALQRQLLQGLLWTPAVGAETSVGFGVVTNAELNAVPSWPTGSGWSPTPKGDQWSLVLEPEGPLCLPGGRRVADNIFDSETEISGGVIKGAIAQLLVQLHGGDQKDVTRLQSPSYRDLCREFTNLRVLHAKPAKQGVAVRPSAIPLSAIELDEQPGEKDVAISGALPPNGSPAFRIDWKTGPPVCFGQVDPPTELRVRTQIDSIKRRAKDENLFAYKMLVPKALGVGGAIESFHWLSQVSFSGITPANCAAVQSQLAKLLSTFGIPGVGKLKTRCVVSQKPIAPAIPAQPNPGNHAIVVLQTPALLCDVADISHGSAKDVYQNYWSSAATGDTVRLVNWFASQSLVGGNYIKHHFRGANADYRPYLMTDAGSVFVLEGVSPASIDRWIKHGLPIASSVRQAFALAGNADDWQRCPYVPQNGFGEVSVNLEWHWKEAI